MAIDVTVGGATADSYLTVAEADAYAAADVGRMATGWSDATVTTEQKEAALKRATRDVDRYVGSSVGPYYANVVFDGHVQSLVFPRSTDIDLATSVPIIPPAVKLATWEQAKYVLANADVLDDAATRRARGLSSFTEPNVGGQLATDPTFGALAPAAIAVLSGPGFEAEALVGWIETD